MPTYSWGKLFVPHLNPRIWDAQVYEIDRLFHLGLDPNRFLVALLESIPGAIAAIDWSYTSYATLVGLSVSWFLTQPRIDARHRFVRGLRPGLAGRSGRIPGAAGARTDLRLRRPGPGDRRALPAELRDPGGTLEQLQGAAAGARRRRPTRSCLYSASRRFPACTSPCPRSFSSTASATRTGYGPSTCSSRC